MFCIGCAELIPIGRFNFPPTMEQATSHRAGPYDLDIVANSEARFDAIGYMVAGRRRVVARVPAHCDFEHEHRQIQHVGGVDGHFRAEPHAPLAG